jgi:hypothetical protein
MSSMSLSTVCFATPVMRTMALMLLPSTSAEMTWTRFAVFKRFMM